MALFEIRSRTGSGGAYVRAKCFTCARNLMAEVSHPDQIRVWRDPGASKIRAITEKEAASLGYTPIGKPAILNRW